MRNTRWTIALLLLTGGCFKDPGTTASTGDSTGTTTAEATSTGSTTADAPTTTTGGGSTSTSSESGDGPTSTTGPADGDPCDPWDPKCPAGSKCAAWADDDGPTWNANRCVPAGDDVPGQGCTVEGSPASGQDSCQAGAMCYDVDPVKLTGTCFALCDGSMQTPLCGPGTTCFINNGGAVNLCVLPCDPLVAETCAGVCVFDPVRPQFICLLDASGPTALGDPCATINGCPASSVCVPPTASSACEGQAGCCQAYCDMDFAEPCNEQGTEYECVAFFTGAPPQFANVGLCVVPPMAP